MTITPPNWYMYLWAYSQFGLLRVCMSWCVYICCGIHCLIHVTLIHVCLQRFGAQAMDDGVVEVVGFWSSTFVSVNTVSWYTELPSTLILGQTADWPCPWWENSPMQTHQNGHHCLFTRPNWRRLVVSTGIDDPLPHINTPYLLLHYSFSTMSV